MTKTLTIMTLFWTNFSFLKCNLSTWPHIKCTKVIPCNRTLLYGPCTKRFSATMTHTTNLSQWISKNASAPKHIIAVGPHFGPDLSPCHHGARLSLAWNFNGARNECTVMHASAKTNNGIRECIRQKRPPKIHTIYLFQHHRLRRRLFCARRVCLRREGKKRRTLN